MIERRSWYSHWLRCGQDGSPHSVQTLDVRLKLGTVGVLPVPGAVPVSGELWGLEGDVVGEGGELARGLGLASGAVMEEVNKLGLERAPGGGGGRGRAAGGGRGEAVRRLLLQIKHIVTPVTRAVTGGVAGGLVGVIALAVRGRPHIHAGKHRRGSGGVTMVIRVVTST